MPRLRTPLAVFAAILTYTTTHAQLRVVEWNITNFSGSGWRDPYFKTALFADYLGRSVVPDVLVVQEMLSSSAATAFKNILNAGYLERFGVAGDYQQATFVDGPDTDNMFYYRSSKVTFVGQTTVYMPSGSTSDQPRATLRYDVRPVGYNLSSMTLYIYSTHMKAGSASTDNTRKALESARIRANAATLPAGSHFLVCGDFNAQKSTDQYYQNFVGAADQNGVTGGRFYDPIKTPGSWENNSSYKIVHTQEPGTQMDSRHDQILISSNLWDSSLIDYIGNPNIAYSTSTWNDANHSYRSWGNDGTTPDLPMKITGNTMVGPTIADALVQTTRTTQGGTTNGHLPVFLDLKVPADMNTTTSTITFPTIKFGQTVQVQFGVTNSANVSLWTAAGIQNLRYTMTSSNPSVIVPTTQQTAAPGVTNTHTATLNANFWGNVTGTITITSADAPMNPTKVINIQGRVLPQFSKIGFTLEDAVKNPTKFGPLP